MTGFSWAPPPPADPAELLPDDERPLVEAVREAEGFPVRYTTVTPGHALAHARRDITVRPTTTLLFELAASRDAADLGVRTVLSGWGGDELLVFNGRGYFADLLRTGHWITLQREFMLRGRVQGIAVWKQWIVSGILPLLPTVIRCRLRPGEFPGPLPLPASLRADFAATLAGVDPLARSDLHERPGVRRAQIALLQHGHLSYRMESWADHGATLGITYAFPLLDQRLVEFALSVPDNLFFKNGWKRYIYRAAMDGVLPDRLRWNPTKQEPAMAQAHRRVWKKAAGSVRAAMLEQADNPFVDVRKLVADLETGDGAATTGHNEGDLRSRHRETHDRTRAGRAACLPFAAIGTTTTYNGAS